MASTSWSGHPLHKGLAAALHKCLPLHKGLAAALNCDRVSLLCRGLAQKWNRALDPVPCPSLHRVTGLSLPAPASPSPPRTKQEHLETGHRERERERERESDKQTDHWVQEFVFLFEFSSSFLFARVCILASVSG